MRRRSPEGASEVDGEAIVTATTSRFRHCADHGGWRCWRARGGRSVARARVGVSRAFLICCTSLAASAHMSWRAASEVPPSRSMSLTVTRTLQGTAAGLQLFPTKTVGSQWRILLPRTTVTSLRQHRRRQQAEARGNPPGSNPHGLVFVTTAGQPVDAGALNKNLVTLCKMAGIHRIRVS